MTIGLLTAAIHIPESRSLKAKRRVLRSLKDRIRARFNVAVAELEDHNQWQSSLLGIVSIGRDKRRLNGLLSKILDLIVQTRDIQLLDHKIELG